MLLLRTSRGVDPGIPLLRSLGSNAHVWLPGASGVSVASLASNNYLLSTGETGFSGVDAVVGLDIDAMGSAGTTELIVNGDFATDTGWTKGAGTTISGGSANFAASVGYVLYNAAVSGMAAGGVYDVTFTVSNYVSGSIRAYLGVTAAFGTTVSANGTYTQRFGPVAGAEVGLNSASAFTGSIDNFSVKAVTGIHLTQATTANKPLVRRGAYNLIAMSEALSTAPWSADNITITDAQAANAGGQLTLCKVLANASVGANIVQSFTSPSTALTMRFLCRMGNIATRGNRFSLYNGSTASELARFTINYSTGAIAHSIGSGATATDLGGGLWEVKLTQTTGIIAGHAIFVYGGYIGNTATAGDFAYIGEYHVEAGTSFTTYTPTTTTAASNPTSGKYWWSFDGSNDSLLSGNLGITNACTIVIAGRVNSLSAIQYLFGEAINGVQVYINIDGSLSFGKVAIADILVSSAGQIVAGVPFVITVRLSGGTAVFRLNGVQIATGATAYTFSATTGARIGTSFNGTSYPIGGAIGWVVPLPVALSDADCLTVERLVGTQFPGMATF